MSKFKKIVKSEKITTDNFKLLFDELKLMRNPAFVEKNKKQCCEVISLVIEYVLYGEKYETEMFDLFCEYNFLNEFIYLSSLDSREISLEIIKSFSMLILNLTSTTTLYYIFSNNFINHLLSHNFEKYDDEIIAYYVNFIKSLSLKINLTSIQFFFQKQNNTFPLIEHAMKYYNHPDPMIKTTVRNIFLTLLKLKYEPIYDYFSSLPAISYFPFIVCNLRDLIIKMNDDVMFDDKFKLLNDSHDEMLDLILYVQDIFSLEIERINYILINCLVYYLILPLLVGGIVSISKPIVTIQVCIYMISLFFKYIKNQSFLNTLYSLVFFEKIDTKIFNYIKNFPPPPQNYFNDWSEKKAYYSTSFSFYISTNFSKAFVQNLLYQFNSPYQEVISLALKYEKVTEDESLYSNILKDLLEKFHNSELSIIKQYHKCLSFATGINVGLYCDEIEEKNIFKHLERFFSKYRDNHSKQTGENKDLVNNECRENLFMYLKSKDDTLILLVNMLIYFVQRSNISKDLLLRTGLLKSEERMNEIEECKSQYSKGDVLSTFSRKSSYLNETTISLDSKNNESFFINHKSHEEISYKPNLKAEIHSQNKNNGKAFSFDNNYFKDLFIENPYFVTEYNHDLINPLVNLLKVEPHFRTITIRLIHETIFNLAGHKLAQSTIDTINKVFENYFSSIKQSLNTNKNVKEAGYEIFIEEWKSYTKKNLKSIIDEMLSRPYLLIPFNLEDVVEDYPSLLKIQTNELKSFRNKVILFMSFYDLISKINDKNSSIKDKYPLLEVKENEDILKNYNKDSSFALKMSMDKNKNKGTNYQVFIDRNNLSFCIQEPSKPEKQTVKFRYATKFVEAYIEKGDPKLMNLRVKDKNDFIYLITIFEDNLTPPMLKEKIDINKSLIRDEEINHLLSYLETLATI